jgi:hypothetical protein
MGTRRIVTGYSSTGESVVISDGLSPWIADAVHVRSLRSELLWQTASPPRIPSTGVADPAIDATTFLPPPGYTTIQVVDFPPDASVTSTIATPGDIGADFSKVFPGLAGRMETQNPGMHFTDTIDYCVLLEGEIVLELDGGRTTVVRKHDVVIQNGTRHGWRNPSGQLARMLFVMIGGKR